MLGLAKKEEVKADTNGGLPPWFVKLPGAWQTSYADLCVPHAPILQ